MNDKTLLHELLEDNNLIEQPLAILIMCKKKHAIYLNKVPEAISYKIILGNECNKAMVIYTLNKRLFT